LIAQRGTLEPFEKTIERQRYPPGPPQKKLFRVDATMGIELDV
jgi:hypothetical protein